jgi:hypothetical protein
MLPTLAQAHHDIVEGTVRRLMTRSMGLYAQLGEPCCRSHVELLFGALQADLAADRLETLRTAMQTIINELGVQPLIEHGSECMDQGARTCLLHVSW